MPELSEIKSQITLLQESTSRIEKALIGDEKFKQKGIIHIVQEHQKHIENDKNFKAKVAGGLAVGTPIFVMAWHWIVDWFKNKA